MAKAISSSDTVDNATHFLHRLQADGWAIKSIDTDFDYASTTPKSPKFPVEATITIKLLPTRP
jgi:hypothetical protein